MNLCGIHDVEYQKNETFGIYSEIPTAANRIKNNKLLTNPKECHPKIETGPYLVRATLEGLDILAAIKSGALTDIEGTLLDDSLVKKEVYLLSGYLAKIGEAASQEMQDHPEAFDHESMKAKLNRISNVSREMLFYSVAENPEISLLTLMAKYDSGCSMNQFPKELYQTIVRFILD